jgi:hypothetical protein
MLRELFLKPMICIVTAERLRCVTMSMEYENEEVGGGS